jgi:hypothetical protein
VSSCHLKRHPTLHGYTHHADHAELLLLSFSDRLGNIQAFDGTKGPEDRVRQPSPMLSLELETANSAASYAPVLLSFISLLALSDRSRY